jgi:hypothetical protein
METQDDGEIKIDGSLEHRLPENQRQNSDESLPIEVLETMRSLIVEHEFLKVDNEKLKKAQLEQQEINEVLFHSIVTKKIPEDDNNEEDVSKKALKNSGQKWKKGTVHPKVHLQLKTKQK